MTRILALDTSTSWGGVAALVVDGDDSHARVLAERGGWIQGSHAERLIVWIDRMLADLDWPRQTIDAYVATRGPGSFTGIRVGLGTVQGLGLAAGRAVIGVTTLEALAAAHGPCERQRVPVIDAGRGELYGARFDAVSFPPVEHDPPWVVPADRLSERLPVGGSVVIPAPGAAPPHPAAGARIAAVPSGIAAAAGRVAATRIGEATDRVLAPVYVRPPDALFKRAKKA